MSRLLVRPLRDLWAASRRAAPVLAALAVAAAGAGAVGAQPFGVEPATPSVTFARSLAVEQAPGQPDRLYVVEQGTRNAPSRILTLVPGDAAATVFLDLTGRAVTSDEAGLLGLAFHPDYATNGRFYVDYTVPGGSGVFKTRVAEFRRSASNPLRADAASERVVIEVDQPAANHNGGTVAFGPDGFLYVALGDGGGQGDPFGNGQNPATLLGAILRLDIDASDAPYGIPSDNPFASGTGTERPEIWAYGFRNPYKIDVSTAGLWVGDVGQDRWEEVDRVEAGGNYGWNEVEGPECFRAGCDLGAFRAPVLSYPHTPQGGFSITGGFVVTASGQPLSGRYVYGDFISGRLWAVPTDGSAGPAVILEPGADGAPTLLISSIDPGPDAAVLVTDYRGTIYRLVSRSVGTRPDPDPAALAVALAGPNPSRGPTAVRIRSAGPVRVSVIDVQGREVAVLWDGPAPGDALTVEGALAPGVYTVRAVSAEGAVTARLVRLR